MNSNEKKILFRVDANTEIGLGHLVRCFALAQELKKNSCEVTFLSSGLRVEMIAFIKEQGFVFRAMAVETPGSRDDARETIQYSIDNQFSWIILDGYHFGDDFQNLIEQSKILFLSFDDYGHLRKFKANLVLNQNCYANEKSFSNRLPHTKLLLGSKFALLRNEFDEFKSYDKRISPVVTNLLLTFGGSDTQNCTQITLDFLNQFRTRKFAIQIVVGSLYSGMQELKAKAAQSFHDVAIAQGVDSISNLMEKADVAFTAGGSTCWELCFMGVPFFAFVTAENQKKVVKSLSDLGICVSMGRPHDFDVSSVRDSFIKLISNIGEREIASREARQLVDGNGRTRVASAILDYKIY